MLYFFVNNIWSWIPFPASLWVYISKIVVYILHLYLGLFLHLFILLQRISKYKMSVISIFAMFGEINCLYHLRGNNSQGVFFLDRRRWFLMDANLMEGVVAWLLFLSCTCSTPPRTPRWWQSTTLRRTSRIVFWTAPQVPNIVRSHVFPIATQMDILKSKTLILVIAMKWS